MSHWTVGEGRSLPQTARTWAVDLERRPLERAVYPASLFVALDSLRRNGVVRNYRITRDRVFLDADLVALELVTARLEAAA